MFVLIFFSGCVTPKKTAQHRDWSFVKSVGGMRIGTPKRNLLEGWFLAVKSDVSGMFEITEKPTITNSNLILTALRFKIEKKILYLWIETNLAHGRVFQTTCYGLKFNKLNHGLGEYTIKYLNPDNTSVFLKKVFFQ